jgi:microcystin-dependent protein
MSTPYVGQLLLVSFGMAGIARVYVPCNGQTIQISQNQALFALLGTTFGGNGQTTFLLPNLQGRTPIGFGSNAGNNISWGQLGGEDSHTLVSGEVPAHNHSLNASTTANSPAPTSNLLGTGGVIAYSPPANPGAMNNGTLSMAGSSQAHENRQPFIAMNWLIALTGIFPSRN